MRKLAKATLPILAAMTLFVLGTPAVLRAGPITVAPEMDRSTGIAAVALMAGAVLVIRGRGRK